MIFGIPSCLLFWISMSARFYSNLWSRKLLESNVQRVEAISKRISPPAVKTFVHSLFIHNFMPPLLHARMSMAFKYPKYAVFRSVYWQHCSFSVPALNNVVVIMFYMQRHVLPKALQGANEGTTSCHVLQISDGHQTPRYNLWGKKRALHFYFSSEWYFSSVT